MAMHLDIESGIPVPKRDDLEGHEDLLKNAAAAANAARLLQDHGVSSYVSPEDKEAASAVATAYARDPAGTSLKVTPEQLGKMEPGAVMLTDQILKEFGHEIVKDAVKVRHLVMNKLVQETENPDPRIRIRALELLGKITDVGLFTERSEVTVTHQSTEDLRGKLREKLSKLKDITPAEEVVENE